MKLKQENGKEYIFDIVRKKYILNQPEEWVRQHIIQYLNKEKGYPISLMAIERKQVMNNMNKRCDIICHNSNGKPVLLVECKAPNIKINKDAFNQGINYQTKIKAKYILITNGSTHYCFQIQNKQIHYLNKIPPYTDEIN